MNYRDYKKFAPHSTYHVYNRGVAKMDIFLDEEDYIFFLRRLKENIYPSTMNLSGRRYVPKKLPEESFDFLLYTLIPNHFHFGITQNTEVPVSALISKVCTSYSKYFNKKYDRVGPLFQDEFKAVLVESNEQLLYLTAYIHRNPLEAGLVGDLSKYPYSSHLDYLGLRSGNLCKKDLILGQFTSVKDYEKSVMTFEEGLMPNFLKIDGGAKIEDI